MQYWAISSQLLPKILVNNVLQSPLTIPEYQLAAFQNTYPTKFWFHFHLPHPTICPAQYNLLYFATIMIGDYFLMYHH
jgi:hypothetical protein